MGRAGHCAIVCNASVLEQARRRTSRRTAALRISSLTPRYRGAPFTRFRFRHGNASSGDAISEFTLFTRIIGKSNFCGLNTEVSRKFASKTTRRITIIARSMESRVKTMHKARETAKQRAIDRWIDSEMI